MLRDFIERFDLCFYPLIAWVLLVLNRSAIRQRPRYTPIMGWSAAVGFLAALAQGYTEFRPADGLALFAVLVCAGIISGVVSLAVFIVCPVILGTVDSVREAMRRRTEERRWNRERAERDEAQRRKDAEVERQRQDTAAREQARLEWHRQNPPAPPPTREQLAAAAKARHDATLAMIAGAGFDAVVERNARLEAEQIYMNELDAIWKRK